MKISKFLDSKFGGIIFIMKKGLFICAVCLFFISCEKDTSSYDNGITLEFGNTIFSDSTKRTNNGQDSILVLDTLPSNNILSLSFDFYMDQERTTKTIQASAVYNNYLFQFFDGNIGVYIYDLKGKKLFQFVELPPNGRNHCNNVSFSKLFYDKKDEYPLLYVSGSRNKSYNHVQVYRIEKNDSFKITQVQEISLPKSTQKNNLFWTSVAIDNDNNSMYAYGNNNGAQFAKFSIPDISLNNVALTDDDILDQFTLDSFVHHQGAVIKNGIMYVTDGVPQWGDTNYLRIIDLYKHTQLYLFNLTDMGYNIETEGLSFYNNTLLVSNCKRSGIYMFRYIVRK